MTRLVEHCTYATMEVILTLAQHFLFSRDIIKYNKLMIAFKNTRTLFANEKISEIELNEIKLLGRVYFPRGYFISDILLQPIFANIRFDNSDLYNNFIRLNCLSNNASYPEYVFITRQTLTNDVKEVCTRRHIITTISTPLSIHF